MSVSGPHEPTGASRTLQVQLPTVPRSRLWDDFGPVGEGASRAHYVRAENGNEYLVKGPTLNPDLPYVAANELAAAQLASHLALPVLDFRLIEQGDALFFGSAWMQKPTFHPAITKELFFRAANRDRNYDIVCFDYWIYNIDRHQHNLIVRTTAKTGDSDLLILLNDHSHSLIQPNTSARDLSDYADEVPTLHLDFLRESIRSQKRLNYAIELIQGVSDGILRAIVASIPDQLLAKDERGQLVEFLCHRRDRLSKLFEDGAIAFPNLKGGST